MPSIVLHSHVGSDGGLNLRLPRAFAGREVEVAVSAPPSPRPDPEGTGAEWHEFVEATYGSCAQLGLEEPEDLPLPAQES
jgi:hypothetical protein